MLVFSFPTFNLYMISVPAELVAYTCSATTPRLLLEKYAELGNQEESAARGF